MKATTTILTAAITLGLFGGSALARDVRVVKTPRPKAGVKVTTPRVTVKKTTRVQPTIRISTRARYPHRVRAASTTVVVDARHASIDFDVDPEESRIWVDGAYRGTADDLDGFPQVLTLTPGTHRVRIETPDGQSTARQVELAAGDHITVDLEMED